VFTAMLFALPVSLADHAYVSACLTVVPSMALPVHGANVVRLVCAV
jgi:hypothetical protein